MKNKNPNTMPDLPPIFFTFFFNIHKLTFPKRFTFDESSDEKKNLT